MSQAIPKRYSLSHQRVLDRRDLRNPTFLFSVLAVVVVVVVVTLFYLWTRLMVVNMGYEISGLNKERRELVEENKRLKLEVLTLKSPQRIEEMARRELGLIYPRGEQIVKVESEGGRSPSETTPQKNTVGRGDPRLGYSIK